MPTIEVLDPSETKQALSGHRFGSSAFLAQIADALTGVVDTEASVYVEGLNESTINALRTKMKRRGMKVAVRRVDSNGKDGHLVVVTTIR